MTNANTMGHHAHQQGHAAPVNEPRQHVAAELVGAQPVGVAGALVGIAHVFEAPGHFGRLRVHGGDDVGEKRRQHHGEENGAEAEGQRIAFEPTDDRAPIASRAHRDLGAVDMG